MLYVSYRNKAGSTLRGESEKGSKWGFNIEANRIFSHAPRKSVADNPFF